MADAANRAALGVPQKLGLFPRKQLNERAIHQRRAHIEVRQAAALRELVPGADQLAVVAAVDAVADQRPQFQRDGAGMLDCEIGNTAARVDLPLADDGLRRTHVHARRATAAMPRCGRCGLQGQIDIDLAEKKHRARIPVEHQRVFAAPALAAAAGQLALEHGRGIGEGAMAELAYRFADAIGQFLQTRAQHLVIITSTRIHRHNGFVWSRQAFELERLPTRWNRLRQVIHACGNHADRARHQLRGPRALETMRGHIVHLAMKTPFKPVQQRGFC